MRVTVLATLALLSAAPRAFAAEPTPTPTPAEPATATAPPQQDRFWRLWPGIGLTRSTNGDQSTHYGPRFALDVTAGSGLFAVRAGYGLTFASGGTNDVEVGRTSHTLTALGEVAFAVAARVRLYAGLGPGVAIESIENRVLGNAVSTTGLNLGAAWSAGLDLRSNVLSLRLGLDGFVSRAGSPGGLGLALGIPL